MSRVLKFIVSAALLATAVVAAPFATSAAGSCAPTPMVRDAHTLTAALYNPSSVTGDVDATGCDIGVYKDNGAVSIDDATIHGARYFGVAVRLAGSSLAMTDSTVEWIGDSPLNGTQHGVGIYVGEGATGAIDNVNVRHFQKNGTAFSGDGTAVDITNSNIVGEGRISYTAQNGIQYSSGASGTARGNTVTDIYYTGCSPKDAAKTGCVPYVATAILLYDIQPNAVDTSRNFFRDDQRNLYVGPSSSL